MKKILLIISLISLGQQISAGTADDCRTKGCPTGQKCTAIPDNRWNWGNAYEYVCLPEKATK